MGLFSRKWFNPDAGKSLNGCTVYPRGSYQYSYHKGLDILYATFDDGSLTVNAKVVDHEFGVTYFDELGNLKGMEIFDYINSCLNSGVLKVTSGRVTTAVFLPYVED